ncbi:type II toxin-antitoxin system RelE/ParE family toxin [Mucilaginibacter panaciglaebae]|uniref:type II toxin-antitoxin system RelE/ParE family toxin n=1 Tax=Mucilaginibacter panaciglaebae TaxID=502331 RepID=UPI003CD0B8B7
MELIIANPLQYPLKKKAQEVNIDKYPYLIIYRIHAKRKLILVVSVFHTSRHPKRKY